MNYRGRHIKEDEFGADRPSPIPVVEGVPEDVAAPIQPAGTSVVVLNTRDSVREVSAIINQREDEIKEPLLRLWQRQGAAITAGDIRQHGLSQDALMDISGGYEGVIASDINPAWFATAAIGAANVERGIVARFGSTPGTQMPVSLPGPFADEWIRTRTLNLVVDVTDGQRIAAQSVIQRGLKEGLNERVIARRVQSIIGLTNREAKAVENLRAKLIKDKVDPRFIDRIVNKKAKQLHLLRARRIARTEHTWAHGMGQLDAVKSYQQAGWIPRNMIVAKKWRKVLAVECPFCDALDGQIIAIDSTFPGATPQVQSTLTPPAHPNCACAIDIVIFEATVFNPFIGVAA